MFDKLQSATDKIPRWGELNRRQRFITGGISGVVALIVVVAVVLAVVGTVGEKSEPAATGPSMTPGFADCVTSESEDIDWDTVKIIGSTQLPYRAGLVSVITDSLDEDKGTVVMLLSVCTEGITAPELKDIGTILAKELKAKSPLASQIEILMVSDARDGTVQGSGADDALDVTTKFLEHPFSAADGVYAQRDLWAIDWEGPGSEWRVN